MNKQKPLHVVVLATWQILYLSSQLTEISWYLNTRSNPQLEKYTNKCNRNLRPKKKKNFTTWCISFTIILLDFTI